MTARFVFGGRAWHATDRDGRRAAADADRLPRRLVDVYGWMTRTRPRHTCVRDGDGGGGEPPPQRRRAVPCSPPLSPTRKRRRRREFSTPERNAHSNARTATPPERRQTFRIANIDDVDASSSSSSSSPPPPPPPPPPQRRRDSRFVPRSIPMCDGTTDTPTHVLTSMMPSVAMIAAVRQRPPAPSGMGMGSVGVGVEMNWCRLRCNDDVDVGLDASVDLNRDLFPTDTRVHF
jgi:hypothetical protein